MLSRLASILAVAVLLPAPVPPKPIEKPVISRALSFPKNTSAPDRKLLQKAFDLVWEATESGDWEAARRETRLLLASRLVAGPWQVEPIICLAYCSLFAEHVPTFQEEALSDDGRREFQRWLLANGYLTRRLLFALSEQDSPSNALRVLFVLGKHNPAAVTAFPDLAVATALVYDTRNDPPRQYCQNLDWLAAHQGSLAYDMRAVPHELARYLVTVKVSPVERAWAVQKYRTKPDVEDMYGDPEYDFDGANGKAPKKIAGKPYTLMNLHAYGGVCGDKSYYASQIARVLGYPVAEMGNHGGPGFAGHAWVLQLLKGRTGYYWHEAGSIPFGGDRWRRQGTRGSARRGLGGERRPFGWFVNPAGGREEPDQALDLLLVSLTRSVEQRDAAAALAQVALRIPDWVKADLPAGPDVLNPIVAADPPTENQTQPSAYFQAERKLDAVAMLQAALGMDAYNAAVWSTIERMGRTGLLSADVMAAFLGQLETLVGRQAPDVVHVTVLALVPSLPPDVALRFLDAACGGLTPEQVRWAPELTGDLMMKAVDLHIQLKHPVEALSLCERAIVMNTDHLATVTRALERALPIAWQAGRLDPLLIACEAIFRKEENADFGLGVGEILKRNGALRPAALWLRSVYDRTKRDLSGRYKSLRLAVEILIELKDFATAAQWCAELYGETEHVQDGLTLANLLARLGRPQDARVVLLRVQQVEYEHQLEVFRDAIRHAGKR